jgi:hypothetical protein
MQTQAYFEDIQLHILRELKKASISIHIAVAWFTDGEIFDLLCVKAEAGVKVELIITNDSINDRSGLDRERLRSFGGSMTLVGGKKSDGKAIMHNKFCVIDADTVITGSYNWSRQARQNDENITVISEAPDLAGQFIDEFQFLKCRKGGTSITADPGKILSRIEALKHIINLDDEDDIILQVGKLKKLIHTEYGYADERRIIVKIEGEEYEEAADLIDKYTRTRKQLTVLVAPEIGEVRLELRVLELQVAALEDEKAEMERVLHTYQYRHAIELGEIIRRLLSLRAERLQKEVHESSEKEQEYQGAKRDYEEFSQDDEQARRDKVAVLVPEEQVELKALFRASSKFCHPDLVSEDQKAEAACMFHRLMESNERNDLDAVREIYDNLRKGIFSTASGTLSDAQRLHLEVVRMRTRVTELARSVRIIRSSDAYRKVARITDWDEYFSATRQKLQEDLARLEVV